jgi:hypothetical protein
MPTPHAPGVPAAPLAAGAQLPPPPGGLPRRVVSVTGDDDPAHTRPTVPTARGTPTAPSAGVVVSLDDQIEARYGALLDEAEARGEAVAHCGGLACWEGEPRVCACACEGGGRAAGLLAQATREVTGERTTRG